MIDSTLLTISRYINILASFCESVFEACLEAFAQVIVLRVTAEYRGLLPLIQDFTNQNAIDSNTRLATKVHDAGVGVALLVEEVLVIPIHEVVFNWLHSLFDAFKHQMMPARREPQELAEVCHVKLQQSHYDSGVQAAVVATELQVSPRFLDQYC